MTNHRTKGPLNLASQRLEDFCFNLYFSFVYDEAWRRQETLENEYIEAFLRDDKELMAKKEREIALCEGAFELTAQMIDQDPDQLIS